MMIHNFREKINYSPTANPTMETDNNTSRAPACVQNVSCIPVKISSLVSGHEAGHEVRPCVFCVFI